MAELKTRKNNQSVDAFIAAIPDEAQRNDSRTICQLMERATGDKPAMWGSSIIGFGNRKMKYASGRELEWMVIGFSPRKQNLTLYIMEGFEERAELLAQLGKHSTGKGCLYVKRLSDINLDVLKKLIDQSVKTIRSMS